MKTLLAVEGVQGGEAPLHLSKELAEIFTENLKCKISKEIGGTATITANKKNYRKGMIAWLV